MKIIIPSFILAIFIIFYITQRMPQKSKLRIINVMETYMARDSIKLLVNDSSGFNLAYYEDFEVYEEPITQYIIDSTKTEGNVIKNIGHESKDTLFNYFLTKKGMDKVLMYEALDSKNYIIINRDSLLRKFNINEENLETLSFDLGVPNQTIRNKKTNVIEIEHFVEKNPQESYADTTSRYYNIKLKDIDFSYSPALDKEKKSKLAITRFIYLPRRTKQKDGKFEMSPYIEDSSMMRETRTKREDIYLALIERFKRDSKNLSKK